MWVVWIEIRMDQFENINGYMLKRSTVGWALITDVCALIVLS